MRIVATDTVVACGVVPKSVFVLPSARGAWRCRRPGTEFPDGIASVQSVENHPRWIGNTHLQGVPKQNISRNMGIPQNLSRGCLSLTARQTLLGVNDEGVKMALFPKTKHSILRGPFTDRTSL